MTVTIVKKEQSPNVDYMTHYTLLYRGREYSETLEGKDKDRFNVGDKVIAETYKDKRQNLCFVLHGISKCH